MSGKQEAIRPHVMVVANKRANDELWRVAAAVGPVLGHAYRSSFKIRESRRNVMISGKTSDNDVQKEVGGEGVRPVRETGDRKREVVPLVIMRREEAEVVVDRQVALQVNGVQIVRVGPFEVEADGAEVRANQVPEVGMEDIENTNVIHIAAPKVRK